MLWFHRVDLMRSLSLECNMYSMFQGKVTHLRMTSLAPMPLGSVSRINHPLDVCISVNCYSLQMLLNCRTNTTCDASTSHLLPPQ